MMLPWSWILTLDKSEWIQVNKKFYTAFLGISKGIFKVHVEIPKNANLFWQNYIDNTSKAHLGIFFFVKSIWGTQESTKIVRHTLG